MNRRTSLTVLIVFSATLSSVAHGSAPDPHAAFVRAVEFAIADGNTSPAATSQTETKIASLPQAFRALGARGNRNVDPEQRRRLTTLADALDDTVAQSLGVVVDAFLRFDSAALHGTRSELLNARNRLLKASVALAAAVPTSSRSTGPCDAITIGDVLALDLSGCDNVYPASYFRLSIDVGGNDVYRHNGGGNCGRVGASAAIDLGGDDLYDPTGLPCFGVNGGAGSSHIVPSPAAGVVQTGGATGLLLDAGGDDTYLSRGQEAANGASSAHLGGCIVGFQCLPFPNVYTSQSFGFLLDASGNDVYSSTGTNAYPYPRIVNGRGGGPYLALGAVGAAMLLDAGGTDVYIEAFDAKGDRQCLGGCRLVDCTVVPKGSGAQMDLPNTGC